MLKAVKEFIINNAHWFIVAGVAVLCAIFLIAGHPNEEGYISLTGAPVTIADETKEWIEEAQKEWKSSIIYADKPVKALIVNENGEEEYIDAPTVESIDSEADMLKCPEGEECGLGAYVYAPTDTYQHFKDYTYGKCWNVDGAYGAQCWDLGALFWMNYTSNGRSLDTCGTGAAKGAWNCKEKNAGTEFDLGYDKTKIKTGDWVITGAGTWGHVCQAAGPYNNGYVACLGQNQGGSSCPGGGAATNIINLNLSSFLGFFHPKTYVEPTPPEPTPTPTPTPTPVSNCDTWYVKKGDTMSGIMKTCKGYVDWAGMNAYADGWISQKVNPGKSVFWGWTHGTGYGLFAGDTIIRK